MSIQSNRIVKIENLDKLVNLEELYISHNGIQVNIVRYHAVSSVLIFWKFIKVIENLEHNTKLQTLDLAGNRIKLIQGLSTLSQLEEFWFNDNLVEDWAQLDGLTGASKLATVYFERNPIQKDVNYRRKIKMALPSLTQIDASLCRPI